MQRLRAILAIHAMRGSYAGTPREDTVDMTRMLTVGRMMQTVLRTVRDTETISIAEWEMTLDEIHHLLVVDNQGKLVGMISDRDIANASRAGYDQTAPVRTIMSSRLVTVVPTTLVTTAVDLMLRHGIGALPVLDDRGQPIGIVTRTDFLDLVRRTFSAEEVAIRPLH